MCHTPTKSSVLEKPESESGALHNFSSRASADVSGAGISAVACVVCLEGAGRTGTCARGKSRNYSIKCSYPAMI